MNALPTLRPIDPKPLQEAMATLRSLPEYSGETMEQAEANTVTVLHGRGVPVPLLTEQLTEPPVSHLEIAAWKRHEQRLEAWIIELQNKLDTLRERIRNVESR